MTKTLVRTAYCCKHEAMYWILNREPKTHSIWVGGHGYAPDEVIMCDGPFADCEPPETDPNYEEWLFGTEEPETNTVFVDEVE